MGYLGALGIALGAAACGDRGAQTPGDPSAGLHSERGGIGVTSKAVVQGCNINLDPRRSLAVTEQAIVSQFTLQEVMNQLATQNGGTGLTSTQLFRQLWDTQNPAPGQADLAGNAHCTDNGGNLNGFPYPCRPSPNGEGKQAPTNATVTMASYSAVGLFNRFDLAPSDGADCGEYRVVFAKTDGSTGRNFIIFEAALTNPHPELGLEGCRPVANFWRDLSSNTNVSARASALHSFYLNGLPGFLPVIHINHYGNNARNVGQVRTNQFIQGPWLLREFKLQSTCPGTNCTLKFAPVTVKTNPFGNLFNPSSSQPLATEFQTTFFPSQVAALAVNDINAFSYIVPDKFNVGQSDAQTPGTVDDFLGQFGTGASAFRTRIQNQLTAIGSTLTPNNIIARAQTQSCGGCHQRSNGAALGGGLPTWPSSSTFVHSTENSESGPEGTRFQLSPALTGTFLPHRKQVLEGFLCQACSPEVCNGLDDDCDGTIDNGNPGGNQSCGTGQPGVCAAGTTTCSGGQLVCNPIQPPSAEVCNGLDDNCNGSADENLGPTICGIGVCQRTVQSCISGVPQTCTPGSPSTEVCNGFDDDCNGVVDNIATSLTNGEFEGSASPWALSGNSYHTTSSACFPGGGLGYNYLGGLNNASGTTSQTITVPSGAMGLTFSLNVNSDETSGTASDFLFVEVLSTGGTLLSTLATYSNLDRTADGAYVQRGPFSLSAFVGQTVRLQFRATTNASNISTFRIDNVSLGCINLAVNGGFETGSSPWQLSGNAYQTTSAACFPGTGAGYNYLGGLNNASGSSYQTLTIPAGANPNLVFSLNVNSDETSAAASDFLFVEVLNASGTLLGTLATFSNLDRGPDGVYVQRGPYNLGAFAGQTVRLQFRATTNASNITTFRIDNVSVL